MRSKVGFTATILSAAGMLVLSSTALATNGYFTHGVGTESKGMAGTGVGSDAMHGPVIVASNPALGVFADDNWEIGLSIFSPLRSYKASDSFVQGGFGAFTIGEGKYDSGSKWFPIPYVAKNWRVGNDNALTLVFYGRGGMNTTWDDSSASAWFDPTGTGGPGVQFPGTYGGGDAGVDLSQAFLSLNYSGKVGDNFAWGFGPVFAVQLFEAKGVMNFMPYTNTFNDCFFTQLPGSCDPTPTSLSDNGHDTSTGWGAAAGIWWAMGDWVSAGLGYQSKMSMSEFKDYSDLFAESGGFDIPSSLKFGLSFKGTNDVRVNLDIEHTRYSEVDSVGNPMANIFSCPYAIYSQTGDIGQALQGDLESCLGGKNGAGFGWHDMTTYKLGIEWYASETSTWRAGYSYGKQPIREADVLFNILAPGVMEQHITLGLTTRNGNGGAWTYSFMYAPSKSIKAPSVFDPTQTITLEMHQYEFEVSYSF
jgi:long-chain fatty acid transport protein